MAEQEAARRRQEQEEKLQAEHAAIKARAEAIKDEQEARRAAEVEERLRLVDRAGLTDQELEMQVRPTSSLPQPGFVPSPSDALRGRCYASRLRRSAKPPRRPPSNGARPLRKNLTIAHFPRQEAQLEKLRQEQEALRLRADNIKAEQEARRQLEMEERMRRLELAQSTDQARSAGGKQRLLISDRSKTCNANSSASRLRPSDRRLRRRLLACTPPLPSGIFSHSQTRGAAR